MSTDDTNAACRWSGSHDLLGPLPEPAHMTPMKGMLFNAAQMRAYATQERERCADWLEREGRHDMAYGIRSAMHCGCCPTYWEEAREACIAAIQKV